MEILQNIGIIFFMTIASPQYAFEPFSVIRKLPHQLTGTTTELLAVDMGAWDEIKKLSPEERVLIVGSFNIAHYEMPKAPITSQEGFEQVCEILNQRRLRSNNADVPARASYLVKSFAENRPVGTLEIFTIPFHPFKSDTPFVAYYTLPDFRGNGYAPDAALTISNHILNRQIASSVKAFTKPNNAKSVNALTKAGFQETGTGQLPGSPGETARYFIKENPSFPFSSLNTSRTANEQPRV